MSQIQILVVEDEGIVARDLANRLAGMGYGVAGIVSSGEEAVNEARKLKPDLALMDVVLAGETDGIAAAGQIQTSLDIPVVYLTAYADDRFVQAARLTEPFGFVLKPFDDRQLRVAVEFAVHKHRMQSELSASERRYRLLADHVMDVLWSTDMNLRLTYLSPSVTRLTGYGVDEAMALPVAKVVTPASFKVAMSTIEQRLALEGKEAGIPVRPIALELEIVRKDGSTFWAEFVATFLRSPFGQPVGVAGIARDVTERRREQDKLRKLYRQEKKLRRELNRQMATRAEFLRALAHELKTPLTPVLASSELLVDELKEEPHLSLARNIHRGALNLSMRVSELLDLARGEMGMLKPRFKPVDALSVLREVGEEMVPVADKGRQSLQLELPASLPPVWADEDHLRQVVLNLLTNAFKFTLEGGTVTLRAREEASRLIVEVQDTGRGISKKDQRELFKPYQRLRGVRADSAGMGLGLAICKLLVELHGGQVWVNSRIGRGSTFGFSIPLEAGGRREGDAE